MSKGLIEKLLTPLSQMHFATDDDMMAYIVEERTQAARCLEALSFFVDQDCDCYNCRQAIALLRCKKRTIGE